jgi:hypothetical protein
MWEARSIRAEKTPQGITAGAVESLLASQRLTRLGLDPNFVQNCMTQAALEIGSGTFVTEAEKIAIVVEFYSSLLRIRNGLRLLIQSIAATEQKLGMPILTNYGENEASAESFTIDQIRESPLWVREAQGCQALPKEELQTDAVATARVADLYFSLEEEMGRIQREKEKIRTGETREAYWDRKTKSEKLYDELDGQRKRILHMAPWLSGAVFREAYKPTAAMENLHRAHRELADFLYDNQRIEYFVINNKAINQKVRADFLNKKTQLENNVFEMTGTYENEDPTADTRYVARIKTGIQLQLLADRRAFIHAANSLRRAAAILTTSRPIAGGLRGKYIPESNTEDLEFVRQTLMSLPDWQEGILDQNVNRETSALAQFTESQFVKSSERIGQRQNQHEWNTFYWEASKVVFVVASSYVASTVLTAGIGLIPTVAAELGEATAATRVATATGRAVLTGRRLASSSAVALTVFLPAAAESAFFLADALRGQERLAEECVQNLGRLRADFSTAQTPSGFFCLKNGKEFPETALQTALVQDANNCDVQTSMTKTAAIFSAAALAAPITRATALVFRRAQKLIRSARVAFAEKLDAGIGRVTQTLAREERAASEIEGGAGTKFAAKVEDTCGEGARCERASAELTAAGRRAMGEMDLIEEQVMASGFLNRVRMSFDDSSVGKLWNSFAQCLATQPQKEAMKRWLRIRASSIAYSVVIKTYGYFKKAERILARINPERVKNGRDPINIWAYMAAMIYGNHIEGADDISQNEMNKMIAEFDRAQFIVDIGTTIYAERDFHNKVMKPTEDMAKRTASFLQTVKRGLINAEERNLFVDAPIFFAMPKFRFPNSTDQYTEDIFSRESIALDFNRTTFRAGWLVFSTGVYSIVTHTIQGLTCLYPQGWLPIQALDKSVNFVLGGAMN